MPVTSLLLPRLRQETSQSHRDLEDSVQVARCLTSESGYQRLLETFYGFYLPMEDLLSEAHEWQLEDLHFDQRRKADWLKQDLQALGSDSGEIGCLPACEELPDLDCSEQAFGSFYVLEGSTLGGRHISKKLQESPIRRDARRFFQGYGEETATMWKQFCGSLERFAERADHEKIIEGANATFISLNRWIAQQGIHA